MTERKQESKKGLTGRGSDPLVRNPPTMHRASSLQLRFAPDPQLERIQFVRPLSEEEKGSMFYGVNDYLRFQNRERRRVELLKHICKKHSQASDEGKQGDSNTERFDEKDAREILVAVLKKEKVHKKNVEDKLKRLLNGLGETLRGDAPDRAPEVAPQLPRKRQKRDEP